MIGTNNLKSSSDFYDIVLNEINMVRVHTSKRYVGYAEKNNPEKIDLYITTPYNKEMATNGNGTMIALMAKTRDQVNKFHEVAIKLGALNEGSPGQRPVDSKDYYAYIRDINGNKICVHTKSL